MTKHILLSGLLLMALSSCKTSQEIPTSSQATTQSFNMNNIFAKESTLPFHTFDFSQLKIEDFAPAFDEGMKQQLAEIEKIANNPVAPTFENTLVEMEKSGQLLRRASRIFYLLVGANTNEAINQLNIEYSPKFSTHYDVISGQTHLNSQNSQ